MSNRQIVNADAPPIRPEGGGVLGAELFEPQTSAAAAAEVISRPALTYFQDAMHRLRQNRVAMASVAVLVLVTLIGIVGPWFFPPAQEGVPFENQQNSNAIDESPTKGEALVVVDDAATAPDDLVDAKYDATKPLLPADKVAAPADFKIEGPATVNGVQLTWTPEPGVSGYQVFRMDVDQGKGPVDPKLLSDLKSGAIERGFSVAEIGNPAQHSYYDATGLDASERYAYSLVAFVDDAATGQRTVSPTAAIVVTSLVKTIKLSDAQAVDPKTQVGQTLAGRSHYFGTDNLGRDVLARMIAGTRIDMLLALLVPTACILIGLILGAVSGLVGGHVDTLIQRVCEIVDNFPDMLVFILLQVAFGKSFLVLFIAMTAFSWAGFARLVRGEVLRMRELEFVQASRLLGAPVLRLIARHIGPNLLGLIIIAWSARIPGVIASETFLSMLGLGLEQPTPSWGNVVTEAARRLQVNPVQFFLPASVLALTLLAFYLLGDALRDAFDPKLRGRT